MFVKQKATAAFVLLLLFFASMSGHITRAAVDDAMTGPEEARVVAFVRDMQRGIQLIQNEHVNPATEAEMIGWAVAALFKETKTAMPEPIADRLKKLPRAKKDERFGLLHDARLHLKRCKELEKGKDLTISMEAICARLESSGKPEVRSGYLSPQHPIICDRGRVWLVGVGLKLQPHRESGLLQVVTPAYGGPAHKAGIRGGDLILQIRIDADAEEPMSQPRIYSTKGMTVEEANQLLLGKDGSKIRLIVLPAGKKKED